MFFMNYKKIGVIVADRDEFLPLEKIAKQGEFKEFAFLKRKVVEFNYKNAHIVAIECGTGKVNAAAAAVFLLNEGCKVVLNYGLSGGISGISRGEICICDKFSEHDFDLTPLGYKPCEKPGQEYIYPSSPEINMILSEIIKDAKTGAAVTGDRFVSDKKTRDFLKDEFGAMCCDMETAAIAYVCSYSGLPFASVRRVSDDADETAAENYREMNSVHNLQLHEIILECADKLS